MRWGFRHDPEGSFWSKVDRSGGPDACWEWTAFVDNNGYGALKVGGKKTTAHRYSLELALDRPIRSGMLVCHRCNNRTCVNPSHLYEGTPKQNVADMIRDGTRHRQPGNTQYINDAGLNRHSGLTDDQILTIYHRARSGETSRALGREYGISHSMVTAIATGYRWSSLTGHKR